VIPPGSVWVPLVILAALGLYAGALILIDRQRKHGEQK
jgi:hypothetical protein